MPDSAIVGSLLFAMFEGGGNVPLITPVVAAMVERGHDVTVVAGPSIRRPAAPLPSDRFLDRVRGTGARVDPLLDVPIDPLAGYTARAAMLGRTPDSLGGAVDVGRIARWSTPWAEGMAARLAGRRPDALACDFFLFGALAAGESAGLPTAALVHNSSVNWPLPGLPLPPPGSLPMRGAVGRLRDQAWATAYDHVARREGLRFVNEARARLGLRPVRRPNEQVERATRVLVMGSRAFELPLRVPLPENVRHVGAIPAAAPDASWDPPDNGSPLVLVSLSTLPQGQSPVMRRVLEALRDLPVRAVVTLGPALAGERFDVPTNVQVEAFVPHEIVLPHVAAVVTQCGLSTIMKVLAAGLPMVCLPVLGDQPANAARITAVGAGVRLAKGASATDIGAALRLVLDDPRFGQAARSFAATLSAEDPKQLIVDELEALMRPTRLTPCLHGPDRRRMLLGVGVVSGSQVDMAAVRAALARAADELCALVASSPNAGVAVPGSDWSVGEIAAHVVVGTEAYVGYLSGHTEPFVDVSDIAGGSLARSSADRLAAEPEREVASLVERMRSASSALVEETDGRSPDEVVIWHGHPVALGDMLGIGLGEYLLHGRDIATALSRPWIIRADDARLVLGAALPLLPLLVDPVSTAHVHARYDLRVRGGARVAVTISDGELTVADDGQRADCHVSADPVALLLIAYGRRSQWFPILTGKLLAWGRKPWLGPRLVRYLVAP